MHNPRYRELGIRGKQKGISREKLKYNRHKSVNVLVLYNQNTGLYDAFLIKLRSKSNYQETPSFGRCMQVQLQTGV